MKVSFFLLDIGIQLSVLNTLFCNCNLVYKIRYYYVVIFIVTFLSMIKLNLHFCIILWHSFMRVCVCVCMSTPQSTLRSTWFLFLVHDALRPSYPKHLYTNPLFWMSSLPRDYFYGITRVSPDKWYPIKGNQWSFKHILEDIIDITRTMPIFLLLLQSEPDLISGGNVVYPPILFWDYN